MKRKKIQLFSLLTTVSFWAQNLQLSSLEALQF